MFPVVGLSVLTNLFTESTISPQEWTQIGHLLAVR